MSISHFNLNSSDVFLCCLPLRYVAAKLLLARAYFCGARVIVCEPKRAVLPVLLNFPEVSVFSVVPMQLQSILQSPEGKQRLESCKCVLVGGAAIAPELEREISGLKAPLYQSFGMTETLTHFAVRALAPEMEAEYTAMKTVKLRTDERGCLALFTPVLNDWLQTNDLVELHGNSFRWKGRFDNTINSGGVKIQPEEIEELLQQRLPGINCMVTWQPDLRLGQRCVLLVEALSQEREEEINSVLQELEAYKRPKEVISYGPFVYLTNGKIDRKSTREAWLNGGV